MVGSANNGGSYTFTNLNPNTTYTYIATLTGVANIYFTVNGTVTTMPAGTVFKAVLCKLYHN